MGPAGRRPAPQSRSVRALARALAVALLLSLAAVLPAPAAGTGRALADTGVGMSVDFGTGDMPLPTGSVRDFGQPYGGRTGADQGTGQSYGWVTLGTHTGLDLRSYGRVRTNPSVTDPRATTFVHMQPTSSQQGAWELAVPSGSYRVTVGAGDAAAVYNSVHAVSVEGMATLAPYAPTSTDRLRTATTTVRVDDGRLTVSPTGGTNTKLTFVEVASVPSPLPVRVDFGAPTSVPPAGWQLDAGAPFGVHGGRSDGWVAPGTGTPRDMTGYGRQRATAGQTDPRIRNFVRMQPAAGPSAWGSWEVALPDGRYTVTIAVGDASATYDSVHAVAAEGVPVVGPFQPTTSVRSATGSAQVQVADGRLTLDATGTNTKIEWVEVGDPGPGASATAEPVRIDFGAPATTAASGYLLDDGAAYGPHDDGTSWGWVQDGTGTPLDLTANGRQRSTTDPDVRVRSFVHMQFPAGLAGGTGTPGAWELAVPPGTYAVQVGVGDASAVYNSVHAITAEGVTAVAPFVPTAGNRFAGASVTVPVSDGRLTLRATGGTNTKITFVVVTTVDPGRPGISTVTPDDGSNNVIRDTSIAAELVLPNGALNPATVTPAAVSLTKVSTGTVVPASVNTSAGGDVVVLSPTSALDASSQYLFRVGAEVRDVTGAAMNPFSIRFTTGFSVQGTGIPGVAFTRVAAGATGRDFSSLAVGPDHRLYAATLDGNLLRYTITADGILADETVIPTVRTLNGGADRTVIGLAFDPASTAAAPVLWVSDNAPWSGTNDVADFTGSIDQLSGDTLQTGRKVVTGLPRSAHDHMTNSLAFGPDGALYVSQGSNSGMGDPDLAWADRPERLLSASILRVDTSALPTDAALDVGTDGAGTYDPYAVGAPVTLYATGIRNAYDLVWHHNGNLYAPTNGSSSGSNVPATPAPLPGACSALRPDLAWNGPYAFSGPASNAVRSNPIAQPDVVLRVHRGGYYGHPDPARCEYVSRGGNPTASADPLEEPSYRVGVLPDRNLRAGDVFDAGEHASADGALEYRSAAFGGALAGRLLIVRYSAGKDVMAMDVSGPEGAVVSTAFGITGLSGFDDPVDVAEDVGTGNLYVSELGGRRITLARPAA